MVYNVVSVMYQGIRFVHTDSIPKEMVVTATGTGNTREDAINNALLSGIQETIGVLIVFAITHRWDKHSIYRLASSRMWKPVLYLLIFIITLTSFLFSSGSPADFIYFDF